MRRVFRALLGAISLTLAGCGAEADKGASTDAPEDIGVSEDVGVSMSGLTNCVRTELSNSLGGCGGPGYFCEVRLMQNNFVCSEGVVGQASTEVTIGTGFTSTVVATSLFGQSHEGYDSNLSRASIATQWGNAYASTHTVWCLDSRSIWRDHTWHVDPFTKNVNVDGSGTCGRP